MLCILYKFISLFTPFVHFTLKWHDVDKEVENKKPTSNLLYWYFTVNCNSFRSKHYLYLWSISNISVNNTLNKRQTIAFSACLGSSGRTLGPHQPVEFDSVLLNDGGAYDPRHGTFRAPVSGDYHFAVTFLSSPPVGSWIEIVRDGNQLV